MRFLDRGAVRLAAQALNAPRSRQHILAMVSRGYALLVLAFTAQCQAAQGVAFMVWAVYLRRQSFVWFLQTLGLLERLAT